MMIEFNRKGEAMQVVNYNRKYYEKKLSIAIVKDLQLRNDLFAVGKPAISKIDSEKVARKMKFSD